MRKLTAILLIAVIVAAPVSRYTDYVHCMAMIAMNLQKNCGCDRVLVSICGVLTSFCRIGFSKVI